MVRTMMDGPGREAAARTTGDFLFWQTENGEAASR